jgi:DNA-directed RNA polymerase sigma subunit (sigma70/sigma32)
MGVSAMEYPPIPSGSLPFWRSPSFNGAPQFEDTGEEALLTAEQHRYLTNFIKDGDAGLKQKILVHNLPRVTGIAKHYTNRGLKLIDLVRAGNLGLVYALENFESEGGFRFSTYSTRCIRQNIECAIANQNTPSANCPPFSSSH